MKGFGSAAAGVLGVFVVVPLFLVAAMNGEGTAGEQVAMTQASSGALNTSLVPPPYVTYVLQAAATCAEESAPLIAAQIEAESGWNPDAHSPAGAEGIAQFMPGTWSTWGRDYDGNGSSSPFDPGDAIPAQGALMCALFAQVKSAMASGAITRGTPTENALAAYNCGLGNVVASKGFPTGISETDSYVPTILQLQQKYTPAPAPGGGGATGGPGGAAGSAGAVAAAEQYLGYPYVWGGGDTQGPTGYLWSAGPPVGFDCEGLTRFAIYRGYHVDIGAGTTTQLSTPSLRTVAQRAAGAPYPLDQMVPGDVVLLNLHPSSDGAWGHVALYIGNGQFIHAPHPGAYVEVVPVSEFNTADWVVRRVP